MTDGREPYELDPQGWMEGPWIKDLRKGKLIVTNGKIYGWCEGCDSLVRVNKPILRSIHVCAGNDEND